MHRRLGVWRSLAVLSLVFTSACSSLPAVDAPAWRPWSAAHGGVVDPSEATTENARAQAALARIAGGCACAGVTVRVLGQSDPAAFAWRDGSLFVTRGLVALLSDDELSAALAHEVGHLTGKGDGLPDAAAEQLADRIGGDVLRASGLSPALMPRMLRKLERAQPPGDVRIAARIAALEARPGLLAAAD